MKVKVTAEHIRNGRHFSACACPVALALTEVGFKSVAVGTGSASVYVGEQPIHVRLSTATTNFIRDFDKTFGTNQNPALVLQPFEAEVEVNYSIQHAVGTYGLLKELFG